MFVDTTKIAVTEGEDTIFIKSRMDFGTQSRVQDALTRITLDNGAQVSNEFIVTIGAQNLALMVHNIVGWEGPGFRDPRTGHPVPCTKEQIERLDPDEPIIPKVLAKINELNAPRPRQADPKSEAVDASPASTTRTDPGSRAPKA